MKKVISISESVVPIRVENDVCEVWASADADYDEAKSRLKVKLGSFVRRSSDDKRVRTDWLPDAQTVMSMASFEQGTSIAKEIFNHWVKRVRQAVPVKGFAEPLGHCDGGLKASA